MSLERVSSLPVEDRNFINESRPSTLKERKKRGFRWLFLLAVLFASPTLYGDSQEAEVSVQLLFFFTNYSMTTSCSSWYWRVLASPTSPRWEMPGAHFPGRISRAFLCKKCEEVLVLQRGPGSADMSGSRGHYELRQCISSSSLALGGRTRCPGEALAQVTVGLPLGVSFKVICGPFGGGMITLMRVMPGKSPEGSRPSACNCLATAAAPSSSFRSDFGGF